MKVLGAGSREEEEVGEEVIGEGVVGQEVFGEVNSGITGNRPIQQKNHLHLVLHVCVRI